MRRPTLCLRVSLALCLSASLPLAGAGLVPGTALAQSPAAGARLRAQSGDVLLRRAASDKTGPAPAQTPLARRDEIETRAGSAMIELGSGMVLDLGPDTLVAVIGGAGVVDCFLLRGTASVRAPFGLAPLQIATPSGRIDLRSRDARVRIDKDLTRIEIVEGSAEFVGRGQRTQIPAGQVLEVREGAPAGVPQPLPAPPPVPSLNAVATGGASTGTAPVLEGTLPPKKAPAEPAPAPAPATPPAAPPPEAPAPLAAAPAPNLAPPAPSKAPPANGEPPAPYPLPLLDNPAHPAKKPAAPPGKEPFFGFSTLRLLREKGIITEAEFASALRDMHEAVGLRGADSLTLVLGKWATTLYGFVQADVMWHSTQSFADYGSNFQVARPGTFAGDHGRMQATIRDSRLGVRVQAPALPWLRASAVFELDLLGPTGTVGSTITENSFFVNPNLRVRHAYFKMETPIVDILFGHTWHLFGWQPNYFPTIVAWPGLVGELFSRTTQLRISKTVKTKPLTLEFALAGLRPPERDSSVPEFQGGIRLSVPGWTAVHTNYMTATTTMPLSIGIAGDVRRFTLPELSAMPMGTQSKVGVGVSVDAFIPILRGSKEHKDNSLSIVAEFVTGQGINDMYTGLTGGVTNPPIPGMPTATYVSGVDPGLAVYDASGQLQIPRWTTFLVGIEYYVPKVGGRLGLFANVSRSQLHDAQSYGNPAKVRDNEIFYNAGVFGDLSEAIRLGLDYSRFDDQYADGVHAINDSVQAVGFFFF